MRIQVSLRQLFIILTLFSIAWSQTPSPGPAVSSGASRSSLGIGYPLERACNDLTLTASSAQYCSGTPTLSATDTARETHIPFTGTISKFRVQIGASTPTANATCQVRINGVDQTPTITITGGVAGPASYAASSPAIAVTEGDRLAVSCTGGATTQALWRSWSLWINY